MHRMNNERHRKPDILLILIALVGLAFAATLTLHVHALSDARAPGDEPVLSLHLKS